MKRVALAIAVIALLLIVIGVIFSFMGPGSDRMAVMGDKIGVVEITGVIKDADEPLRQLTDFAKDGRIKAILVRIDSPGGAVGPSQEIHSEIMKIRKQKPVIASIGNLGASGGYYIACAATKVVANPGTITGSIGVIIQFFNFQQLLDKVGVRGNTVKSGDFKDVGSLLRDMTPEERKLIQNVIDDVHAQFIEAVAAGRNLKIEEVAKIADGRIITGRTAKQLKLVDELGNFNDAVEIAKKVANLEGEPKLVHARKKRGSLLELLNSFTEGDSRTRLMMLLSDIRIPVFLSEIPGRLGSGL